MNHETENKTPPTEEGREQPPTPFFARFLEGQRAEREADDGAARMTLKYPSDRDEIDYR